MLIILIKIPSSFLQNETPLGIAFIIHSLIRHKSLRNATILERDLSQEPAKRYHSRTGSLKGHPRQKKIASFFLQDEALLPKKGALSGGKHGDKGGAAGKRKAALVEGGGRADADMLDGEAKAATPKRPKLQASVGAEEAGGSVKKSVAKPKADKGEGKADKPVKASAKKARRSSE
ncbi:hypothetical protein T492DRAFT_69056 [Pavlovales sp. CCMP2436]|nr:hypothetical protein T492DRAFT_69056 [Pavlovales sp. CCMP2436]